MEIRVQPVTTDFFSVEIAVCAVYDSADLLFGSDVSHNGEDLSCKHHANLIREKSFHCTAMIIVIAVKPPFIRSSVDPFVILEMFREPVGLAFQIQDDILDLTSTAEELGKPVGSDEKNEKNTYVSMKGLEQSREDVMRYTKEAIDAFDSLHRENTFLRDLLQYLSGRKK